MLTATCQGVNARNDEPESLGSLSIAAREALAAVQLAQHSPDRGQRLGFVSSGTYPGPDAHPCRRRRRHRILDLTHQ